MTCIDLTNPVAQSPRQSELQLRDQGQQQPAAAPNTAPQQTRAQPAPQQDSLEDLARLHESRQRRVLHAADDILRQQHAAALATLTRNLNAVKAELASTKTELESTKAELEVARTDLTTREAELLSRDDQLVSTRAERDRLETDVAGLKAALAKSKRIAKPSHPRYGRFVPGCSFAQINAMTRDENWKNPQGDLPGKRIAKRPDYNWELNEWDAEGGFPLYGHASGGNTAEVRRLLEAGADAGFRSKFGWTSIHWAVANGHYEVVELLLYYWADVNAVSDTGKNPMGMTTDEKMKALLRSYGGCE